MSDTSCEPSASPLAKPAKSPRNTRKSPRPARLQLEALESRDVLAAIVDVPVSDPPSNVMQASCMSAFFEQSSLYDTGQPATFPTVTWTTRNDERREEPRTAPLMEAPRPMFDRTEVQSNELPRSLGGPQHAPALGSRSTGGFRKLLRADAAWPEHVFAPYVDLGVAPMYDLVGAAETQAILYFNLAHVSADSQNRPSWCGDDQRAIDGGRFDAALRSQIKKLRGLGGDVAVSFGGPTGTELAQAIGNVKDLKNAYREVVDAYGLQRIDFDLSQSALDDATSIERRWQAISVLQHELAADGQKLQVWLTVPAAGRGLSSEAVNAVESALRSGVELGGVNLRTSNGGSQTAPAPDEGSGRHTIEATINAFYQLQKIHGPLGDSAANWTRIGITPTLGQSNGRNFRPEDARALYDFAEQQGVGMIGVWSLDRDQQGAGQGGHGGQPSGRTSSGGPASGEFEQQAFEFSDIFLPFSKLLSP